MTDLILDPQTTALVLIDLQHGIVSRQTAPYAARDVVENAARLAQAFRAKGSPVVYVRVDMANFLQLPVDKSMRDPNAPAPPPEASQIVPEAGLKQGDIVIVKNNWGAFFGTDLERQLRERAVKTVVLGGIATNYGVESTGRAAAGLGFALVTVEDATTSLNADAHKFAFDNIFPLLGRVRSTQEVLTALG